MVLPFYQPEAAQAELVHNVVMTGLAELGVPSGGREGMEGSFKQI